MFGGKGFPRVLLAEIASCQLEYRYLAHLTGKGEYYRAVEKVNGILQMAQNQRSDALWASHWETENGTQYNGTLPYMEELPRTDFILSTFFCGSMGG